MALAPRGVDIPLPGEGGEWAHNPYIAPNGQYRDPDAYGLASGAPYNGLHLTIRAKALRLPLGTPEGPLLVISYDAGDVLQITRVGGHPGAMQLWLSTWTEVGTIGPPIDPSTITPGDYVVP